METFEIDGRALLLNRILYLGLAVLFTAIAMRTFGPATATPGRRWCSAPANRARWRSSAPSNPSGWWRTRTSRSSNSGGSWPWSGCKAKMSQKCRNASSRCSITSSECRNKGREWRISSFPRSVPAFKCCKSRRERDNHSSSCRKETLKRSNARRKCRKQDLSCAISSSKCRISPSLCNTSTREIRNPSLEDGDRGLLRNTPGISRELEGGEWRMWTFDERGRGLRGSFCRDTVAIYSLFVAIFSLGDSHERKRDRRRDPRQP